mmetsp:Transcript_4827/g.12207  ORF Transcript_4827/g.12207 Transcript_4827/m.12207 type:complete len:101 (+) Transcript_4827:411-713(+)
MQLPFGARVLLGLSACHPLETPTIDQTAEAQYDLFSVLQMILSSGSPDVQLEACRALLPYGAMHKVEICKARLVGPLIKLSQSARADLAEASKAVLAALA